MEQTDVINVAAKIKFVKSYLLSCFFTLNCKKKKISYFYIDKTPEEGHKIQWSKYSVGKNPRLEEEIELSGGVGKVGTISPNKNSLKQFVQFINNER